jgi:hypothetical protein
MKDWRIKLCFAAKYLELLVSIFMVIYSVLSKDPSYNVFGIVCALLSPIVTVDIVLSHLTDSK